LADVVFGLVFKAYSTMSGRRFTCELKEVEARGLITKAAHYNSAFRYLENQELTPLLKSLIEQSASPLSAIESDFAVDSSGFSTTVYDRWFDHKYGKMRSEVKWVKAHLMCGVKTHAVTSVEVTPTETADAPQLPELVKTTAKTFAINEVSADKAYSSRRNLHAVNAVGAVPFIPFKSYSKGSQGNKPFDGLWHRMWHFYNYNREAFLEHYHKRSNAETVFSMIKMKFGGSVRSKSPVAQVNEVLCKVLCHNICVLIQSIYELGIEPTFWTFEAKEPVAPKLLENFDF
jgi:transposase